MIYEDPFSLPRSQTLHAGHRGHDRPTECPLASLLWNILEAFMPSNSSGRCAEKTTPPTITKSHFKQFPYSQLLDKICWIQLLDKIHTFPFIKRYHSKWLMIFREITHYFESCLSLTVPVGVQLGAVQASECGALRVPCMGERDWLVAGLDPCDGGANPHGVQCGLHVSTRDGALHGKHADITTWKCFPYYGSLMSNRRWPDGLCCLGQDSN